MKEYLYLEIYNDLKNDIKSGVLQNGDRLPTEKQLTEKYGVSRITAIKAMQKLEVKGYIKRIRGNGTFVTYNNLPKYPNKQLSVNVKSKNIAFMAECSNDLFIYILSAVQRLAISYGYNISIFDTSSKNVSDSLDVRAELSVVENGKLRGSVRADFDFEVPLDCETVQNEKTVTLPVSVVYTVIINDAVTENCSRLINGSAERIIGEATEI